MAHIRYFARPAWSFALTDPEDDGGTCTGACASRGHLTERAAERCAARNGQPVVDVFPREED